MSDAKPLSFMDRFTIYLRQGKLTPAQLRRLTKKQNHLNRRSRGVGA